MARARPTLSTERPRRSGAGRRETGVSKRLTRMITCPECGAQNGADAKFCERCGQGLTGPSARAAAVATLPPLAVGTELKGGFRIVEVLGKTSHENRYRAERPATDGRVESFQLREQLGPASDANAYPDVEDEPEPVKSANPVPEEDPNGKRATPAAPSPIEHHDDASGLATAASEDPAKAADASVNVALSSPRNGAPNA